MILPIRNEIIKVFATNEHILSKEVITNKGTLNLFLKLGTAKIFTLDFHSRGIFYNKTADITLVQILVSDNIIDVPFLELETELKEANAYEYVGKIIMILEHPKGKDLQIANGLISSIMNNTKTIIFSHDVSNNKGSSGSPIILSSSKKVIGIHQSRDKEVSMNFGTIISNIIPMISLFIFQD